MDTGERLAAYLSGDLEPDERTALEAELAGDPALRTHLDRIRTADRTLAELGEADLPDGFQDRLRARLAPELDAVLSDELAARRARRALPSWLPAVGAAAVLALVVAVGVSSLGGSSANDDDEAAVTRDMQAEDAAGGAEMAAPETATASEAPGPVVAARGRTLTEQDLEALASDPDVQSVLAQARVAADPVGSAGAYRSALDPPPSEPGDGGGSETQDADASEPTGGTMDDSATTLASGTVTAADREAIAACLDALYQDAAAPIIPLYVEVATDEDGDDVLVYVALTQDADGAFRRLETWMVERDTCQPRRFLQTSVQPVERNAP